MSNANRKALRLLIFLLKLSEAGHYQIYGNEVSRLIMSIIDLYKEKDPVYGTESFYAECMKYWKAIEDRIEEKKLNSNTLFMLNLTIGLTEHFLRPLKTEDKIRVWENLLSYCQSNLPVNYDKLPDVADMAVEVEEVLTMALNI